MMMLFPPRLWRPLPGTLCHTIVLVIVLCHGPAAAASWGNCSDLGAEVRGVCFWSFFQVGLGGTVKNSWDAGILDGALHLTTDDVYQPPVYYPPDASRWAGCVIFRSEDVDKWSPVHARHDGSFNTSFTMSTNTSRDGDGGLMFGLLPSYFDIFSHGRPEPVRMYGGYVYVTRSEPRTYFHRATYISLASSSATFPGGRRVAVEVSKAKYYYSQGTTSVFVSIEPAPNATPSAANYTVWIDYNSAAPNLSVYVADGGKPKPGQATLYTPLNVTDGDDGRGTALQFGLFASKNRSLPTCKAVVYSWNITLERPIPIRVPDPDPAPARRRRRIPILAIILAVVLAVAAVTAMVLAMVCCFVSRYRALRMRLKLSEALRQLPGVPREFNHAAVSKATHNFHEMMKLGRGGFGAVYKGKLRTGKARVVDVTVKKFTRNEDRGYDDFLAEVDIIHRLRHKNVVPLLGWSYEKGELLLIYEYMPNGSLDKHLFHEKPHRQHRGQRQPILPWERRYTIVKDVAAGLHYVHHEYERTVLHRDIKASNVMLDSAFRGRLGDFGLARVVAFDKDSFTDVGVAGTWGFIAPEYPVSRKATRRTDVYAFGALVLEVVTGRRSLGAADAEFPLLVDWVWSLHGEARLLEAVDAELRASAAAEFDADDDAARLLLLGLACSHPDPSARPTMADVLQVVAKVAPPPDVPPEKPAFVWPPEGGAVPLDDLDDDDFAGTSRGDTDGSRYWEEIMPSTRPQEITKRRHRHVDETNATGDIESYA